MSWKWEHKKQPDGSKYVKPPGGMNPYWLGPRGRTGREKRRVNTEEAENAKGKWEEGKGP